MKAGDEWKDSGDLANSEVPINIPQSPLRGLHQVDVCGRSRLLATTPEFERELYILMHILTKYSNTYADILHMYPYLHITHIL